MGRTTPALLALALLAAAPAEAGKWKWLTDAGDAAHHAPAVKAMPDEPWLRQPDGTYLDLAVVPDGDATKVMGQAEDGSLVELTVEQAQAVAEMVAEGALSLPVPEPEAESELPGWALWLIIAGGALVILWQAWGVVKALGSVARWIGGRGRRS